MTDLEADASVKVVVFQSANPDFFIAHLDVAKAAARPGVLDRLARLCVAALVLASRERRQNSRPHARHRQRVRAGLRHALRQPAECQFGNPEVGVGLVPGGGTMEWLPRLVGRSRALEFVLSADDFDADIAERYGWVNRTLDDGDLD